MLPTEIILQAGSAHGWGLVLRTLQVCASIPGQQGGACAQHGHLGRGSGWLTFHLGSRRLGGLAESLLKTVGVDGRRGGNEKWWRPKGYCYNMTGVRGVTRVITQKRDCRRSHAHAVCHRGDPQELTLVSQQNVKDIMANAPDLFNVLHIQSSSCCLKQLVFRLAAFFCDTQKKIQTKDSNLPKAQLYFNLYFFFNVSNVDAHSR